MTVTAPSHYVDRLKPRHTNADLKTCVDRAPQRLSATLDRHHAVTGHRLKYARGSVIGNHDVDRVPVTAKPVRHGFPPIVLGLNLIAQTGQDVRSRPGPPPAGLDMDHDVDVVGGTHGGKPTVDGMQLHHQTTDQGPVRVRKLCRDLGRRSATDTPTPRPALLRL
ncbi:hypothetical protein ACFS27_25945 [Promicromonospora vindobonensis]|uniref:Uncharacterized protein n=1 Tax=Promicromonospora vindobonensis TaxID=195748 RepID=A0ABW5W0D9_9MICO